MNKMPTCDVCGSSAPIMRVRVGYSMQYLCYHHEAVCWDHQQDPCPLCERED